MKPTIQILFPGIVFAGLLPFIGGCYTQLATVESAYDENQAVEDTVVADAEEYEEFERDYPPPDYYLTFSYYHPGFSVMYSPYDPWDYWYYYPGPAWYSPYYPAYSCWPYYYPYGYYPYHYPVVYYGNGGGGGGGYYPGGGGGSQTRDFGNSRGLGDPTGTRARGGIVGRTGGGDDGTQGTVVPASISRQGRQGGATIAGKTGKSGPPQRKAAVNRPPTRKVQSESAPTTRGNSGSSRGGSVSSPPRSSPPSAPSSSGNRGSSGSGSRSGSPRSR